ncbi:MAG TPA: SGNH/GDSL hydrolase family protein [bacterium]|nr:SGNH/GDSL hydrolase family protein [bacterium]
MKVRDYENVIRHYLAKRPDLNISRVTVCWCLNDLYQEITDIETPGVKWRSSFSDVLLRLRSKSHLFLFLKKTVWDRPQSYYRFDSGFYENDHPWLIDAADRLDVIQRFCEEQQVRFDMILLPYAFQLRPPGDVRPQQAIGKLLRDRGIPYYDLLDDLAPSDASTSLFLYGDGIHFSKKGHARTAERLIRREGIPPAPKENPSGEGFPVGTSGRVRSRRSSFP